MLARLILISAVSGIVYGTLGFIAGLQLADRAPAPLVEEHRSLRPTEARPAALDMEALASLVAARIAVDLEATLTRELTRTLEEQSRERGLAVAAQ